MQAVLKEKQELAVKFTGNESKLDFLSFMMNWFTPSPFSFVQFQTPYAPYVSFVFASCFYQPSFVLAFVFVSYPSIYIYIYIERGFEPHGRDLMIYNWVAPLWLVFILHVSQCLTVLIYYMI